MANLMELCANAVRGVIIAPPGRKLCIADLSNIEGRMLAFLAGEEWKLQAFRDFDAGTGADLYKLAYARAFGIDPKDAVGEKRQQGKIMELALGFQGGPAAFITFAMVYQMDLEKLARSVYAAAPAEALHRASGMYEWALKKDRTQGLPSNIYIACETLKQAWRDAHPAITGLWASTEAGVIQAINTPGEASPIGKHLKARRDGAWLRIRLPSGRYLCYLQPKVDGKGQISYLGVNQYTRQWCRIKTYAGKFVENCTQAAARDVMAHNMPGIDASGYEIVLTVHDELLTETPDNPAFSSDELASMMSQVPHWAPGLPLAAAGFETTRYRKD